MNIYKTLLMLLFLAIAFSVHLNKDQFNICLDKIRWYTDCVFCRGVHFGVVFIVLIVLIWIL